jgi:HJR/Mrr/RecB family endonuclease
MKSYSYKEREHILKNLGRDVPVEPDARKYGFVEKTNVIVPVPKNFGLTDEDIKRLKNKLNDIYDRLNFENIDYEDDSIEKKLNENYERRTYRVDIFSYKENIFPWFISFIFIFAFIAFIEFFFIKIANAFSSVDRDPSFVLSFITTILYMAWVIANNRNDGKKVKIAINELEKFHKNNIKFLNYLKTTGRYKLYKKDCQHYNAEIEGLLEMENIQYWKSLDGIEFEKSIGKLFSNLGYKVEYTSQSGDQGVDLFIDNEIIVQCKAHTDQISPATIREVYGSMMHFKKEKAIVISTGGFTKGCFDFARGKPIELWDIRKIIELVSSINNQTKVKLF